jgi:hypothetical protein
MENNNYTIAVNEAKIASSVVVGGETYTDAVVSVNVKIELTKDGDTVFENVELPLSKPQSNSFKPIESITAEYLKNLAVSSNTVKVENTKILLEKRLEQQSASVQNTEATYTTKSDFS